MRSISFIVPGKPVPTVRTTRKQKFFDKQYQRYEAYKYIVRLSYLIAHIDSILPSTEKPEQTRIISEKRSMMRSRDVLLEMIGTVEGATSNFIEVSIRRLKNE